MSRCGKAVPKVETFQDLVLEPREVWQGDLALTLYGVALRNHRWAIEIRGTIPSTRNLAAQYGVARGTSWRHSSNFGLRDCLVQSECWNICGTGARMEDDLSAKAEIFPGKQFRRATIAKRTQSLLKTTSFQPASHSIGKAFRGYAGYRPVSSRTVGAHCGARLSQGTAILVWAR